jgi:transglutaminase-like putative cysteine protease
VTTVSIPSTGTQGERSLVLSQGATDALYVLGLGALGFVGFRTVYGGSVYLLVGLIGLVLGIAVTELSQRWKQPVLAEAFVTVLLFLLIGGALAVPKAAVGGILPTENTLRTLGHVGLYGWKELLTAPPPVGNSFDLLALPYIVGLVGGVAGQSVARRTRSVTLPLLGPTLILALGILFGARHPTSLALQGSLFGAAALSWMMIRYHRYRSVIAVGRLNRNRVLTSVALLVIAGAAAGVIGPHLPGSGRSRLVLSRYVVPPFEANAQPSPLAGFRQYATGGSLNKTLLFTVDGAQPGTMVRIATMDAYDGIVWGFGSDAFQRFGSSLPTPSTGRGSTERVTVHVDALSGVWVPDIGQSSRISFVGKDVTNLTSHFSYDPATATAAEPSGLATGDSYVLTTSDPSRPSTQELSRAAAGDATVPISGVPAVVQADANQWVGSAASAWGKVMAIAGHLHSVGKYSDGFDPTVAGSPMISASGHGAGRLTTFLEGGPLVGNSIVGDDEQYAAAFALMANAVGVPARVTLGAVVGANGSVRGSDVHAWVEVSLAGLGWVPISTSAFVPTTPAHETPPTDKPQANSSAPVEPPVVSSLHAPTGDLLPGSSTSAASHFASAPRPPGFRLPAWVTDAIWAIVPPVLLIALAIGVILTLKRRRRRRRRRAPSPSSQIAGAWADLMDFARDLGHTVSQRSTRRLQAMALEEQQASALAVQADAAVFAPGEPSELQVADYWSQVEHFEASRLAGLSRWRQWRAVLSLRSFRAAAGS